MERSKNKQAKLHIRKGDKVKVISGNSKGKEGEVLEVITSKQRAIVQGVNMVTKHVKPSADNPEGGIKKTEAAIHISNLMLIDPATGDAVRTGRKENPDKGDKLQRYSKKTGEFI
ncbi:50S ribosomal protein L24 [Fulvivirga sediminis]|uniref:Large ribosomal subunit protein uL24 n=1 Tax=Fulvivirga sediminis TaxID=2803949 RepID=A0A937JYW0_9BACT|nr:50S ribosomal protein L24 [Fulvivirga sediminis]MBL3656813.1 50S ribosomal protein L24 [Fulvivirga sediminis]